ncbi:MAG: hypothetical protein QOE70_6493 [Chthoniobacter sp.]|jgi:hypothetical protein|nr:hypothetical protein [Chthoniobacter sp.]
MEWTAEVVVVFRDAAKHSFPMNRPKNFGFLLLAIYLIIIGLIGVAGISLGQLAIVVPILALAAGICLLLGK